MKYDELDLHEFLPFGIDLNETNKVESKCKINDFFLKGFESWYRTLQDYAVSCTAPYSIEGNILCGKSQLKRYIEEAGVIYYNDDLEVMANFVQDLYTISSGSKNLIDSLVKYASNTLEVIGTPVPTEEPHVYDIAITGDVSSAIFTTDVVSRLTETLDILAPASEKWRGFTFTQEDEIRATAGGSATNTVLFNNINITNVRNCWLGFNRAEGLSRLTPIQVWNGDNSAITFKTSPTITVLAVYGTDGRVITNIIALPSLQIIDGKRVLYIAFNRADVNITKIEYKVIY